MSELFMKYFVLKPHGDDAYAKASRAAMMKFSREIEDADYELARHLIHWVGDERGKTISSEAAQPAMLAFVKAQAESGNREARDILDSFGIHD